RVHLPNAVHVPAGIHHHRFAERLAILRAAAAPRYHREAFFSSDGNGRFHILGALRNGYADRLDLVNGGIGRIPSAGKPIERDVAAHHLSQARGQSGIADSFRHRATAAVRRASPSAAHPTQTLAPLPTSAPPNVLATLVQQPQIEGMIRKLKPGVYRLYSRKKD